jgi:hypothetical protein
MPFEDLEQLQTSIMDWLARPDLEDKIAELLFLAENKIQLDLEMDLSQAVATGTTTPGTATIDMPADLLEPIQLTILADPIRHIEIVSADMLETVNQNGTPSMPIAGRLRGDMNAVAANSKIVMELAPTPGGTVGESYKLEYWAGVDHLANSPAAAQTNELLQTYPQLLLYGTLLQAAPYIGNDNRIPVWQEFYADAVRGIRRRVFRKRAGGGQLRMRPDTVA